MTITKTIPDPPKLEEPNLKYVERGWGWDEKGQKNYVYWSFFCKEWRRRNEIIPSGHQNRFYLEIAEDFPMPPDELYGYRLTFVPEEEWRDKVAGERYAYFSNGYWKIGLGPKEGVFFSAKAYALAEKIEVQKDDFGNEMPSSLPPMPEAPEGYRRKYEVGPTEKIELGAMCLPAGNVWQAWEEWNGHSLGGSYYIRLVPEKRYWSKPSDMPISNIWVMQPMSGSCVLVTSVNSHAIYGVQGIISQFKYLEKLRWSDSPFDEYVDGKECLVEG